MLYRALLGSLVVSTVWGCDECSNVDTSHEYRLMRRMQPGAIAAKSLPRAPLEFGDINFLHTTDTHGWLAGHLKERNYGADWGDFVSFTKAMRQKASSLGVDLLMIDTGDLHDGNGLSDATVPNGLLSNSIFQNLAYDVLTPGNHEVSSAAVILRHFNYFGKFYGERYVTSNVQVFNSSSNRYEYLGSPFRYFTTENGIRIMAFGVLFDFRGGSNITKVTPAAELVQQQWFKDAVNYSQPIDLFLVIGHNPVRPTDRESSFQTVYKAIREVHSDIPIQIFGGHRHIRDFYVYDNKTTGLASALSGLKTPHNQNNSRPNSAPRPTREAAVVEKTAVAANLSLSKSPSRIRYARRYLDWNRLTFEYHAKGSQGRDFDSHHGKAVTAQITAIREHLNISYPFGCAPQDYCSKCSLPTDQSNVFLLLSDVIKSMVVNQARSQSPRLYVFNSGLVRFDIFKGPFTQDDAYTVIPYPNTFTYIADVPYAHATQVLSSLNKLPSLKKRYPADMDIDLFSQSFHTSLDDCTLMSKQAGRMKMRYLQQRLKTKRTELSPGYTTTDDFGNDGDDTIHTNIPNLPPPNAIQANASFPENGSLPTTVDLIFPDFIGPKIIDALKFAGSDYTTIDIKDYMPKTLTTKNLLPLYAQLKWQANMPNCPLTV